jgi:prepilin-type N-terminal cleavage/methylation domain-containing protein
MEFSTPKKTDGSGAWSVESGEFSTFRTTNPAPRGFTLVEMLVVITIMVILMGLAATMMRPATQSRRAREASRAVNVYLASARNRAIETGRPCGVTFYLAGTSTAMAFAMKADQCEVPTPYCGATESSVVSVTGNGATATAITSDVDAGEIASLVSPGDSMQLNFQGPIYKITGRNTDATGGTLTLTCNSHISFGGSIPWTSTAINMPYRIFRSPMKAGAEPLQLPANTVVDLPSSGAGASIIASPWDSSTPYFSGQTVAYYGVIYVCVQPNTNQTPTSSPPYTYWEPLTAVTVLFSPAGAVDKVYCNAYESTITDPIYLLVGKRERMLNSGGATESTWANFQDPNNLWIVVNPHTGTITSEPVGSSSGGMAGNAVAARGLAGQAIGIGGK